MNGQSEEDPEENSHFNQEFPQTTSCDLIKQWLLVLQLCHAVFRHDLYSNVRSQPDRN